MDGFEYEVHDGDDYFAGCWHASDDAVAFAEAMHYAAQCDDFKVYRVVKTLVARRNA